MATDVAKELAALQRMGVAELREKYAQVFGEATTTGNRTWLVRRIAWRIQADAEGDLSERAKARAAELARDADLRITAPRQKPAVLPLARGGTRTGTLAREMADGRWRVPKRVLVANVRALLASGRFKVADGLPEAAALLRELADFRVAITGKANETFGAGASGGHDDLVLAVALAVWNPRGAAGRPRLQPADRRPVPGCSPPVPYAPWVTVAERRTVVSDCEGGGGRTVPSRQACQPIPLARYRWRSYPVGAFPHTRGRVPCLTSPAAGSPSRTGSHPSRSPLAPVTPPGVTGAPSPPARPARLSESGARLTA